MQGMEVILKALVQLRPPPRGDSVWVGPFEQLAGAAYSLLMADRHGASTRNLRFYYSRVQAKLPQILGDFVMRKSVDQDAFNDWLSGFYFNSAIQRIVWSSERLVSTFAGVPCSCGDRAAPMTVGERPYPKDITKVAKRRLTHVETQHPTDLPNFKEILGQLSKPYRRSDRLDARRLLAMLRYDVNNRKHSVYLPSRAKDRVSAGRGDQNSWSTSGVDVQMGFACKAYALVVGAYEELLRWGPNL